jgi:serine protease Do
VVSAKDRTIGAGPYDAFIQTDASINPGNSGGPLFNTRGEVVGINSAIIASGQGIGFAIPINMAKNIMAQLREKGSVTRGWLGVQVQTLTPELRESMKLGAEGGALVAGVVKGDPADKAGLRAGDVIVEFDGRAVRSDRDLVASVGNTAVGKTVPVTALRDGKSQSFEIKIAKRSDEKDEAAGAGGEEPGEKESGKARLGVRVQDVTKDLAEKLGLEDTRGALVSEVAPGGPAERAGIERGDVVVEVNRGAVEDAAQFAKLVRAAEPGKSLLLLVRSGGGTRFVAVKPEPAK